VPPGLQIDLKPELTTNPVSDAVVPASGIDALAASADLGQIDDRRQLAIGSQAPDRPAHQAGFASGSRRKHTGESLGRNHSEQCLIGLAPNVACTIRLNRSADDEKILCDFGWQRGNLTDWTD
jgi:hypothetical protein